MLNIDVMILKLQSNKQIRLQRQKIGILVCVLCVLSWQFVCYLSFYLMPRCLCCPTDLWSVTGDGYHTEQAAGCRHRSLRPEKRKHLISSTNNSLVMSNRVQRDSKSNHWQILSTFFRGNKNHCVDLMLKVNNEAKWNVNHSREHLAGGLITTGTEAAVLSHLWRVHAASCSDSDLL